MPPSSSAGLRRPNRRAWSTRVPEPDSRGTSPRLPFSGMDERRQTARGSNGRLPVDRVGVRVNRVVGHFEPRGDLGLGEPLGEERRDQRLGPREPEGRTKAGGQLRERSFRRRPMSRQPRRGGRRNRMSGHQLPSRRKSAPHGWGPTSPELMSFREWTASPLARPRGERHPPHAAAPGSAYCSFRLQMTS